LKTIAPAEALADSDRRLRSEPGFIVPAGLWMRERSDAEV